MELGKDRGDRAESNCPQASSVRGFQLAGASGGPGRGQRTTGASDRKGWTKAGRRLLSGQTAWLPVPSFPRGQRILRAHLPPLSHKVLNTLPSSPIQPAPSLSTYCAPTRASAPAWRNPEAGERNTGGAVLVLALRERGVRWEVGQEGQESRSLVVAPRCRAQMGSCGSVAYPGELGVWAQQSDLHLLFLFFVF